MIRDSTLVEPRADAGALQAFVAVARAGTVGGAASGLGRTQPSVSARIAGLERAWQTRLFRRVARGMELTPEGARLLPRAEAVLRELEELDRLAGLPVTSSTELRVGAGDALGRVRLPKALAAMLRVTPALSIRLREGPGGELLDQLQSGEIDLALVVSTGARDGIDFAPLITSPVQLLVPAAEERWPAKTTTLSRLAGERQIALQPGSGFRRHVERAFAAAAAEFVPAVEVGNLSLVRRFVAAGLGAAPVPAVAFPPGERSRGVRTLRVSGIPPLVYSRAVRAGAPLAEPVRRLLAALADG